MAPRFTTDAKVRASGPSAGGESTGAAEPLPVSRGASSTPRVVPILAGSRRGVAVSGDLDPATASLLDAAVAEVCRRAPARTAPAPPDPGARPGFLLDLRDVTFLDASGLFILGRIHEQIDGNGDELRVAAPHPAGPRRTVLVAVLRGSLPALFSPWSA
jgi:anti-anti-sigma regulatory factor